jgi:endonuclease/exonuclease/phosphatase (EEP) superfamily protein YafD
VVHLLNVHLRPPLGESRRTSTVVTAYFKTRSVRLREIKYHMAHVRGRRPLIVLGDFNESAKGRAARWLKRKGFIDALEKYDPKTATWKWRTSIYTFRKRLDHIFYSRELRCVDAQVLGPAGSDHYPVEAVFQFPKRKTAL